MRITLTTKENVEKHIISGRVSFKFSGFHLENKNHPGSDEMVQGQVHLQGGAFEDY